MQLLKFAAAVIVVVPSLAGAMPFRDSLSSLNSEALSLLDTRNEGDSSHSSIQVDFGIHPSCNASQTMQIRRGLFDMKRLARGAADHLLLHGNDSDLFSRYFGDSADPVVPLGIFERLIAGDKTGAIFRCDDPDENCATQKDYHGHWRGNNASDETVICELSFLNRRPLDTACGFGFQQARDNLNVYWGTDLLHRIMHLPKVTNEFIGHVADDYKDLLVLAKEEPEKAVKNQYSIQNFAFDTFVRENIDPEGCVGTLDDSVSETSETASPTSSSQPSSGVPSPTNTKESSTDHADEATSSEQDCHTHADGTVHCT